MELASLRQDTEPLMLTDHQRNADDADRYKVSQRQTKEDRSEPSSNIERFSGWRRTLLLASLASILVLSFNIGFILWAVKNHHLQNNQGVLYEGKCDTVRKGDIAFHLVINILATALLSASNYCMQCLCAPTRKDLDSAHRRGGWLDIGVQSFRNLFRVSRRNSYLWICLALSSLPLHLMYNSTIFSTISAGAYDIFVGSGLLREYNVGAVVVYDDYYRFTGDNVTQTFSRLHRKALNGTLYQLGNSDCVDAYATAYQSTYGSLILVTDRSLTTKNYTRIYHEGVFQPNEYSAMGGVDKGPYEWICDDVTNGGQDGACSNYLARVRAQVANNNWTVKGYPVSYCLSEMSPPSCKLQYSLPLIVVVIVFNFIKAIIMCYLALTAADTPILTTGDAISSFMREPDQFTQKRCLLSMEEAVVKTPQVPTRHLKYIKRPKRWVSAVPPVRWCFGIIFYIMAILICLILLFIGLTKTVNVRGIWGVPLGTVGTQSLISGGHWPASLVANTIIANTPQLVFSMLYFASNSLVTAMTLAHEWSGYAFQQKGLRVSTRPVQSQRTSYFLSLPYRYAIPLIIMSTVLHWLISQSLFLVGIEAYNTDLDRNPESDIITCGFSPVAIVSTISVGVVTLSFLIGLSIRRFKSGMPVAGSCSLAIAAACHPNPNTSEDGQAWEPQTDAQHLPLQWGSVQVDAEIGHCTFSCQEVSIPEDGRVYR